MVQTGPSIAGYDRVAVDGFFAAVDEERTRLLAELRAARERVARARRLAGSQESLDVMLRSANHAIAVRRREAAVSLAALQVVQHEAELTAGRARGSDDG